MCVYIIRDVTKIVVCACEQTQASSNTYIYTCMQSLCVSEYLFATALYHTVQNVSSADDQGILQSPEPARDLAAIHHLCSTYHKNLEKLTQKQPEVTS